MLQRKISLVLSLALLSVMAISAMAQDTKQPSAAQAAQQQKMKDCNAQATAKSLKGDERKTFMSSCLSGTPAAAPTKMTQQEKMTACNKEAAAKNLKGDDRKAFMSTCLSGSTK
jgi:lipopolysaccharide export system protein LptC